jgi:hypothetical protein
MERGRVRRNCGRRRVFVEKEGYSPQELGKHISIFKEATRCE